MSTPDGLLIVDKPADWTSHDVVARARRLCETRKVGHAGTLDPMATGVLVLGVGRATRLLTFLVGCDKDYTATIRLGQATLTDDAQGELTAVTDAAHVTDEAVMAAIRSLTGDIEQVPSAVSAIKVQGKRAYHRVREGEDVQLPSRPVTVSRFEVTELRRVTSDASAAAPSPDAAAPDANASVPDANAAVREHNVVDVDVSVTVSSGTYVRALARDLGALLHVGGHLTALRRTRVGSFDLAGAHPLAALEAIAPAPMPTVPLTDAARAAFPVRTLTNDEARAIGYGQRIASGGVAVSPLAALAPDGSLTAMLDDDGSRVRSLVVFAPATS